MQETISAMDVRQRLGSILNRVDLLQEQFIVERKGKPLAAIIPIELFRHIQKEMRKSAANFLASAGSDLSDEEAMKVANEVKKSVRRKRRAAK